MAILTVSLGTFNVTRPLTLAFRTLPVVVEGEPFDVDIEVRDGNNGALAIEATIPVTLGVESGPGALLGETTASAQDGVATFTGLIVNAAGLYTIAATSDEAAPASESIDASPGMVPILAILAADRRLVIYFALPLDTDYAPTFEPVSYGVTCERGASVVASVTVTGLRSIALTFTGTPPVGSSIVSIAAESLRSTTGAVSGATVLSFKGIAAPSNEPPPPPVVHETPPNYGPEAYRRMLQDLLPGGAALVLESGTWLSRTLLAIAGELARIDGRAKDLLREQDPRTAVETIDDWERVVGLPDDLVPEIADTIGERQVAVVQRLISSGGQSRAFFLEMAAALGYEGATIDEFPFAQLRVGFHVGDRVVGNEWAHAWQMNLPADGPVYERLDIEAIIRRAAPAHTIVVFSYA